MRTISLYLLILLISFASTAQESSMIINNQISAYARTNHFNGTILVQKGDKILYNESFGLANFEHHIPTTNQSRYKIASITKLFTSVLIMQLKEEGKLDLQQTISTYLPNYKGEGANRVSVFNLLTATSGIESNEKDATDDVPAMYKQSYTTDQLLTLYCSGKLITEPGTVWNYNNADYVILGKIIEAIYKKPYETVLAERILDPLHMSNTGMLGMLKVIDKLADVYMVNKSTKAIERMPPHYTENYYAAGGLYSNADDLLKFENGLYGGHLLKMENVNMILQPYLAGYGMGIWVFHPTINNKKVTLADRQGAIWGTMTRLEYVPEENLKVILLTNVQTASIDSMQAEILRLLIK